LLRAGARLAERRQDLVRALHAFRQASIALGLTLYLNPTITLVPNIETLPTTHLVRDNLSIEELLDIAVTFRPDLAEVRTLVEVLAAERGSTWWGALGPQFEVGYQYGGITGHSNNTKGGNGIPGNLIVNPTSSGGSFSSNPVVNGLIKEGISRGSKRLDRRQDESFGFSDQQRFSAGVGWRLSLAAIGDLKTSEAVQRHAALEAQGQLALVEAQVVSAQQTSRTNRQLITLANEQLESAQEALRLIQANLSAGTATTLDVLQAEDAATQARLRYTDAIVGYNQAQVNLLAALGLLEPRALFPPEEAGS
jgi:outer membrane protein TolC